MACGFDCGTYNLVCCRRGEKKEFVHKREVNAFIEMPLENRFVFNMMKQAGVPLVERQDAGIAYALGESAVNIAYTMDQIELKRPMKGGCLNPQEKHAQQIMSLMIHGLLDELKQEKETLYYSVPANAINEETDADYHNTILAAIFKAFKDEKGNTVDAHPINEALALIYAELAAKAYTGIGISFGAGMVNVCFAKYGKDIFQFSIVNSGDWIDRQAAKATGESPTFINKEKAKLDLSVEPQSLVQQAIKAQYGIMIQKTVSEMKKGIEGAGNKVRSDAPVDIVIAGGTSLPKGFDTLFEKTAREAHFNIEIGKVIRPADPLYSVARGCLIAAENSNQ
jgi:actin-like ATPase involved in cell morphogenesis